MSSKAIAPARVVPRRSCLIPQIAPIALRINGANQDGPSRQLDRIIGILGTYSSLHIVMKLLTRASSVHDIHLGEFHIHVPFMSMCAFALQRA